MKIVADAHIPYINEYFAAHGELVLVPGREMTSEHVKDADMLLVRAVTQVDEKLLAGSRVKFVGSITAGDDHLDTEWLDKTGISWSTVQGFNAQPVADYVVSCVAALERKQILPTTQKRAVVIGVGRIGSLVKKYLKLLNFEVITCDPLRAAKEPEFNSTSLADISDVDLISLHVPLTRSGEHPTFHFIEKTFLQRQKPGCVLLNASRGAVIDSQALMQYGAHLSWCLDVFEQEPNIDKAVLNRAAIATPHIAGYSIQSKIRGIEMIRQAACDRKLIKAKKLTSTKMPQQQLSFAGDNHHWQDIVLGIFSPLLMTTMMREIYCRRRRWPRV